MEHPVKFFLAALREWASDYKVPLDEEEDLIRLLQEAKMLARSDCTSNKFDSISLILRERFPQSPIVFPRVDS